MCENMQIIHIYTEMSNTTETTKRFVLKLSECEQNEAQKNIWLKQK